MGEAGVPRQIAFAFFRKDYFIDDCRLAVQPR